MSLRSTLSSLAVAAAVLIPSISSATGLNVLTYDTASGNGSLYQRVTDGSIEPRVHEVQTGLDPVTKQRIFFEVAYHANMHELARYAGQYECRSKLDVTACLVRKK